MEEFGFEKLEVYKRSIEFLKTAYALGDLLPRGSSTLNDQLRRASLSIPLNIAEGTGKSTGAERNRFYQIARGSALECAAIINCCNDLELSEGGILQRSRADLLAIVQMLSKLATSKW